MKDYLLDIVEHTNGIGCIDLAKIVGDDKSTIVEAASVDKTVVVYASFKTPNKEFTGTFGLPNLSKLNTILKMAEYQQGAVISLITEDQDGTQVPTGVYFENATGDFQNNYRFMKSIHINERVRGLGFKGATWNVEFSPSEANVLRFNAQASVHNDETTFIAKTEGDKLKFYFGDHSSHAGNFVFHAGVTGTLSKAWDWPVLRFLSILKVNGDKTIRFSDEGVMEITVDSGLIVYRYIILAQLK